MVDGPVVETGSGRVEGLDLGDVKAFKGIPYAAAPRFGVPAPVPGWEGTRPAVEFGPAAPQLAPAPGAPPVWRPGDGLDCLSLNIWSPDLGAAGLPVMVWIHGGLWKHGSSRMPQYDGAVLARSGVVVVTINYRLGFEGFGHIDGTADNRGLRDQIAALEWVRANIAGFGGDPFTVTVFGQSAGAASIAFLMSATKGLFRRAIAQSIPAGHRSPAEAADVTATIARAAGVEPTWDGLAALPPEAILAVQDTPVREGFTAFGPVVDGELVTGPPWASTDRDVDLVCGYTREEYRGQGQPAPPGVDLAVVASSVGLTGEAAEDYRQGFDDPFTAMLSDALVRMPTVRVAEAHGRSWVYELAWASPGLGAGHGVDIPLVFGIPETRFAGRYLGSPPPASFGPLSAQIRRAWTAFAATGDPGWPRYGAERRTRIWDVEPRDVDDPLAASRRIWSVPVEGLG
ncbi:carboxylesterase/lipase family protein [Kutzneria sp. CA-103260]|uniref:carboxylesterase/lipase family protein n=1 Tax=Kutzneria sp. CA-103260 TaxID=2802641 RepID=UPI001BA5C3BD|nr:carboxylesterase family protein [Kutzneria sp. CA-103260]QUQ63770.1 carboxylesterase [Kutzneria sp. CA-103260]